jgi:hypothetical protein
VPGGHGTALRNGVVTPRFWRALLGCSILPVARVQRKAVNSETPLMNGSPPLPPSRYHQRKRRGPHWKSHPVHPSCECPVASQRVASRFPLSIRARSDHDAAITGAALCVAGLHPGHETGGGNKKGC